MDKYEAEYIERQALIREFGDEPEVWTDSESEIQERCDWYKYLSIVKAQDAADVVPVVRCEKCIHYKGDIVSSKHSRGSCEFDNERKSRNHFCSYGESKDRNA